MGTKEHHLTLPNSSPAERIDALGKLDTNSGTYSENKSWEY